MSGARCVQSRLDRELPFHYYTTKHDRFFEGERPSFDKFVKPKSITPRQQRVRRREQPGNLALGRVTLINPGSKSICRQFHNLPLDLPPPPTSTTQDIITSEHSY